MEADRGTGIGASARRGHAVRFALALVLAVLVTAVAGAGAEAATAEVLLGSQTVGGSLDNNSAGSAEAFGTTATSTGSVGSLTVYLDATSKATKVVAGLYTDNAGRPGTLLAQGSTSTPTAGAWNQIALPAVAVTAGTKYWISVLGPTGTGEIEFRDAPSGSRSENSSQTSLTSLPATWSPGHDWSDSPISAYASGAAAPVPVLSVSPAALSLNATVGSSNPVSGSLSVANEGSGSLSFGAATDAVWLSVAPAGGNAPQSLSVSASPAGLGVGTYTGHVTVTAPGVQGSPAVIPVTLTVHGSSSVPAFVQQAFAHKPGVASLAVTPASNVTAGDRLVVEVGVWSGGGATAASVTDSAGNHYVELLHFQASERTEMSVWSAPVTAGAGTRPTITVKPTSTADVGVAALEYAGLSTVGDATVVDQTAHATGTTAAAASVASGATAPTGGANELAVGFYVDSGFGDSLAGGSGYSLRTDVSPASEMEFLAEDRVVGAGAAPNATASTGANTAWLMATVVFKAEAAGPPSVPAAPTGVSATAGNGNAAVTWTAPSNGGSPITSYTVTPYVGATALAATTVTGSPPATGATIGGLTNGTAYTFTVTATNALGAGPPSAQSNAVTPTASLVGPVIDASTPAITAASNNVTTVASNPFSPPAASIVYVAVALDSPPSDANPYVASVTNSGSELSWHLKGKENHVGTGVGGFVEVWWAYNPTAQANIAVTANLAQPTKNVTPPIGALQVIVLRNAAGDQSTAAWMPTWDVNSGSAPSATVTTTAPNSLVFAVANNWDTSESPTLPADQTTTLGGQLAEVLNPIDRDTYWVQAEQAPTAVAGPVTMSDSAPSVRYHMIAWEVLAQ